MSERKLTGQQCVDITFAEPHDVAEVNETNCKNTTDPNSLIQFDTVFTTSSLTSRASFFPASGLMATLPTFSALLFAFFML